MRVRHSLSQDVHASEVHSPVRRGHVCQAEAGKQWRSGAECQIPVHQLVD